MVCRSSHGIMQAAEECQNARTPLSLCRWKVAKRNTHQRDGNIIEHYGKTLSAPTHTEWTYLTWIFANDNNQKCARTPCSPVHSLACSSAHPLTNTNLPFFQLEIDFDLNEPVTNVSLNADRVRLPPTQMSFTIDSFCVLATFQLLNYLSETLSKFEFVWTVFKVRCVSVYVCGCTETNGS